MEESNLRGAHLEWVDLRDTQLEGVDLTRALLKGADLTYALLNKANLTDVRLKGSVIRRTARWPDGFDWRAAGVVLVDQFGKPVVEPDGTSAGAEADMPAPAVSPGQPRVALTNPSRSGERERAPWSTVRQRTHRKGSGFLRRHDHDPRRQVELAQGTGRYWLGPAS